MNLNSVLNEKVKEFSNITLEKTRVDVAKLLIDYIQEKVSNHQPVNLNFICTHNSRRSHLSQVWAQTMVYYFDILHVNCYSGGTEATAVYPQVIETLKKTGFDISQLSEVNNPIYSIKCSGNASPVIAFSKTFDNEFNPKSIFAAVMTCAHADENCPYVPGAEARIPLRYDDPKAFDDSPMKATKYEERSTQIASEMFYIFSQIKR